MTVPIELSISYALALDNLNCLREKHFDKGVVVSMAMAYAHGASLFPDPGADQQDDKRRSNLDDANRGNEGRDPLIAKDGDYYVVEPSGNENENSFGKTSIARQCEIFDLASSYHTEESVEVNDVDVGKVTALSGVKRKDVAGSLGDESQPHIAGSQVHSFGDRSARASTFSECAPLSDGGRAQQGFGHAYPHGHTDRERSVGAAAAVRVKATIHLKGSREENIRAIIESQGRFLFSTTSRVTSEAELVFGSSELSVEDGGRDASNVLLLAGNGLKVEVVSVAPGSADANAQRQVMEAGDARHDHEAGSQEALHAQGWLGLREEINKRITRGFGGECISAKPYEDGQEVADQPNWIRDSKTVCKQGDCDAHSQSPSHTECQQCVPGAVPGILPSKSMDFSYATEDKCEGSQPDPNERGTDAVHREWGGLAKIHMTPKTGIRESDLVALGKEPNHQNPISKIHQDSTSAKSIHSVCSKCQNKPTDEASVDEQECTESSSDWSTKTSETITKESDDFPSRSDSQENTKDGSNVRACDMRSLAPQTESSLSGHTKTLCPALERECASDAAAGDERADTIDRESKSTEVFDEKCKRLGIKIKSPTLNGNVRTPPQVNPDGKVTDDLRTQKLQLSTDMCKKIEEEEIKACASMKEQHLCGNGLVLEALKRLQSEAVKDRRSAHFE